MLVGTAFHLGFDSQTLSYRFWNWAGTSNFAGYEMLADIAEQERPTLVIEQWTERYLRTQPPDHPEFQRARASATRP